MKLAGRKEQRLIGNARRDSQAGDADRALGIDWDCHQRAGGKGDDGNDDGGMRHRLAYNF